MVIIADGTSFLVTTALEACAWLGAVGLLGYVLARQLRRSGVRDTGWVSLDRWRRRTLVRRVCRRLQAESVASVGWFQEDGRLEVIFRDGSTLEATPVASRAADELRLAVALGPVGAPRVEPGRVVLAAERADLALTANRVRVVGPSP